MTREKAKYEPPDITLFKFELEVHNRNGSKLELERFISKH